MPPVLTILVTDPKTGQAGTFVFGRSPVRIGRSPLNDLVVDSDSVSQTHFVVRFDERRTVIMDLGSKNGTFLDGNRLAPQRETWPSEGSVVGIGVLALTLVAREGPEPVDGPAATFREQGKGDPRDGALVPTQLLPGDFDVRQVLPARPLGDAPIAPKASTAEPPAMPPGPPLAATAALPAPLVYVVGGTKIAQPVPPPRAWPSTRPPPGRPRISAIERLSALVQGHLPPEGALQVTTALRALDVLISGTTALRMGMNATLDDLGVTTPTERESSPFRDSDEAFAWLLQDDAVDPRLGALRELHADLLFHEVALLGAIRHGVDQLVRRFAPESPAFAARSVFGAGDAMEKYRAYFDEVSEGQWTTVLREAARSYALAIASEAEVGSPKTVALPQQQAEVEARLIGTTEPTRGISFGLEHEAVIVGRGSDVHLRIEHASVSRRHAQMRRDGPGKWKVEDLGSANGTFINGEKYRTADLIDGDEIAFGEAGFRFRSHG